MKVHAFHKLTFKKNSANSLAAVDECPFPFNVILSNVSCKNFAISSFTFRDCFIFSSCKYKIQLSCDYKHKRSKLLFCLYYIRLFRSDISVNQSEWKNLNQQLLICHLRLIHHLLDLLTVYWTEETSEWRSNLVTFRSAKSGTSYWVKSHSSK